MSRWRVSVVLVLLGLPFMALAVIGSVSLWRAGLALIVWWPMALCLVAGFGLAWHWQRNRQLLRPHDFTPPLHWTERDREAWKLVEARAARAASLDPDRMCEFSFYPEAARDMAEELARFYHPAASDPVAHLTIPEILAVVELAAHDLAGIVDEYLPAGHLLTVQDWRRARQVTDWYRTASNVYWVISALVSPFTTGLRYLTSRVGMSRPWQLLQQNLIAWFYVAFVHEVGTYLIDLNSGRLRVGARRYRELRREWSPAEPAASPAVNEAETAWEPAESVRLVGITLVGQVKAGKSSLVNGLLGEQRAVTDVLPATDTVTRYELQPAGISTRLVIHDTAGYGHTGPDEDGLRATEEAARQSDLIFVVVHARNPARHADVEVLRRLRAWFAERREIKMPPVLAVLTHIDLLSPTLEWSPPYDWLQPRRAKEHQIRGALENVREQFGDLLVAAAPVCTALGRVYGINECLLPLIAQLLDEARAVALLRCIHAEANAGKIRRLLAQLMALSRQTGLILFDSARRTNSASGHRS